MAAELNTLEDLPYDEEKAEPLRLRLSVLKDITNNFSEEQVIGRGAYGVVYKAQLVDNFIAVKLLGSFSEIKDKTFEREVDCLVRVKHRNIVGFVGYCAESHWEVVRQGAKFILAESQKRLLCFEYMRNGSLRRHLIPGEPCGLQWHVCYQIVKGMCQGLHYLHEKHIIHLDLKPDNILLDDDMVPKIADFGLSRLLGVEQSRTVTQNIRGSMGYMAPEYVSHGSITIKSDIYSLGVIIMQMLTGHKAEPIIENALRIWRRRLESETSQRHTPLEIGYQQVKACIEISTSCTEHKPENRPVTGDIIRRLGETVASGISTSPERKDVSAQVPLRLQLSLLKDITNNFSEEQVIGSGAYGVVYKALLGDNFIAVKLLGSFSEIKDKTFEREVDCLVRVKHRNIVGFVGYCAESHVEVVWQGAKFILAESQKRLLCFEYMRNGSLRRHLITGEPCGLQWHVCYQIVKGMCQGLHYLHEKHIIHLDLKPDNILLDDDMVPKIADFGLSRLLGVEKSRTVTQNIRGSMLESETSQRHTPLEIGYQQVKACIEISTSCTEHKPENRPVTGDIIRRLGETIASGISTSPESNQFRKDVSAQVPQHASHPVHFDFEAQSQNPPFKGLSRSDVLDASFSEAAEDDPLPGVDGLQITGEAFPGRELQLSGYSTNGTTSCNFEWMRHLEDGSVNFIEGARQPSYLVTADDVDALLAIQVQPLDDRKRKGENVKVYANEERKITCDPETKVLIEKTLEIGHASYEVQLPVRFLDMWEPGVLAIKREGYSIKCNGQRGVLLTEKFQQATAINVPYGRPTEFSIMSADGVEYNLKPAENTPPRDTIVLVLRLFRIMITRTKELKPDSKIKNS